MISRKCVIGVLALLVLLAVIPISASAQIGGDEGWYVIHCNVDGASVYFDGEYKGMISSGELSVPVYSTATPYSTVTVEKSGYVSDSKSLSPAPGKGETRDIYVTLNPTPSAKGGLSITSYPSGAQVYLSGSYRGVTPLTLNNLDAGSYHIKLDKSSYKACTDTVSVTAGQTTPYHFALTPIPSPASITVTSTPTYAYVYMDGAYKGRTPLTITDVSAGTHIIELDLSGYYDWKRTVNVPAGGSISCQATLNPIPASPGFISATSSPSGAQVYIDGAYKGLTSLTHVSTAAGTHTVTLKLGGYQDYTSTVNVQSYTTSQVSASMTPGTPSTGSIHVTTAPAGASVLIDNVLRGVSELTVSDLSAGSHTVTAQLVGYNDATTTVTVTAGQTASVTLALSPVQTAAPGFIAAGALIALVVCGALFFRRRS